MLTPEDMDRFKPELQIVWHLLVVLAPDMNRDQFLKMRYMGHGIEALYEWKTLWVRFTRSREARGFRKSSKALLRRSSRPKERG